ncbi:MAG: DUF6232 family protein [Chryseolinea sp.]
MIPDKIIYTDGHEVVVTDSTIHVKKSNYKLNGIIKHGLYVQRPSRLPSVILVLIGLMVTALGFAEAVPPSILGDVRIGQILVHGNTLAMIVGGTVAFIGVLSIGFLRDRYAVRISTAEGEKNVIVSKHKEYIAQIVDAITASNNTLYNSLRPEAI